MSESIETIEIAVGLVFDSERKRVLLFWNDNWQGFSLPMTKIKHDRVPRESAKEAALRSVAEAMQLPVQLARGNSAQREHCLLQSQRNDELKGYNYHVTEIEIHPEFRKLNRDHRPVIWASLESIANNEIQPVTWSVSPILTKCRELGWA